MHIITALRHYMGISQSVLAKKAGLSCADLNEIENKLPYGMIDKYVKLSKVLGVSVHTLVNNDFLG